MCLPTSIFCAPCPPAKCSMPVSFCSREFSFLMSPQSMQRSQSDLASGATKGLGEPQLCSAKEIFSVLLSLKGPGIPLLTSVCVNFSPRLSTATQLLPPEREVGSKTGLISLHLLLSFPRRQCKIFFFFAICFTFPISKPYFSLFKIIP